MATKAKINPDVAVGRADKPDAPIASLYSVKSPAATADATPGPSDGDRKDWSPLSMPLRSWTLLQEVERKWDYLRNQDGFRHAPLKTIYRLILWRLRCFFSRPAIIGLGNWRVRMFLPAEWRGFAKIAFAFREQYEPELPFLRRILAPGMTFVDAGACYGIYTLAASQIVGETGRVLAFEPSPRAFCVLQKNIRMNSLANVLASPLALSDTSGKAMLYYHPNVGCDSLGRDQSFTETSEDIATESLDGVLEEMSVDRLDVIKMDVQGAEELVLRGASKTLNSYRPVVIFEVYPPCTIPFGLLPYGAWEFLGSLGYEFFVIDRGALKKEVSPPVDRNVVAIHRQSSAASKTTPSPGPIQSEGSGRARVDLE